MEPFIFKTFARWADVDQNAHLSSSAFLDMAVDAHMTFVSQQGFAASEFTTRQVGPVVRRDEIEYLREVRLIVPPGGLLEALNRLTRTADFEVLPSSVQ